MNPKLHILAADDEYLRLFQRVARDLAGHSILKRKMLLSWSWHWQVGSPSRFRHYLHDPDRIVAFLADVRKFHLQKEPLQLPKLFAWFRQRTTDGSLLAELDELRNGYGSVLRRNNRIRILHRGRELSPSELLNTYLNGKYFHTDSDKALLIEELENGDIVPRIVAIEAAVVVAMTVLRLLEILQRRGSR